MLYPSQRVRGPDPCAKEHGPYPSHVVTDGRYEVMLGSIRSTFRDS